MGVAFVPMKYLAVDVVAFDNAGFAAQHGDAFLVLDAGVLVIADGEAGVTLPGAKDQHTPFAGPFDKWLVVALAGKRATPCVIGRGSECDIRLGEPGVSRRHARIARDGSTYTLEDLGSANGTGVAGSTLAAHGRAQLSPGTFIRVGGATMNFIDARRLRSLVEHLRDELG